LILLDHDEDADSHVESIHDLMLKYRGADGGADGGVEEEKAPENGPSAAAQE
jgi:hypothetical protein